MWPPDDIWWVLLNSIAFCANTTRSAEFRLLIRRLLRAEAGAALWRGNALGDVKGLHWCCNRVVCPMVLWAYWRARRQTGHALVLYALVLSVYKGSVAWCLLTCAALFVLFLRVPSLRLDCLDSILSVHKRFRDSGVCGGTIVLFALLKRQRFTRFHVWRVPECLPGKTLGHGAVIECVNLSLHRLAVRRVPRKFRIRV